jgi:hypothetical protein
MPVEVTGIQETLRAIGRAKSKDAVAVNVGIEKACQMILKASIPLCPVEFGPLRASGVVVVEGSGLGTRGRVEFGGSSAPYALYVHENLQAYHAPPTGAKWLEKATRRVRGAIASVVKREIEAGTSKTIGGSVVE